MTGKGRAGRLGKRIGEIVATAIEHEIKDPRLEFVTITDSRITADLRVATLYYTVRGVTLDEEPDLEAAEDALTVNKKKRTTACFNRSLVGEAAVERPCIKFASGFHTKRK